MKTKVCCIFNFAPHYREPIYSLMDNELGCHFYFGDSVGTPITEMDYKKLKGFKEKLVRKAVTPWNYFWLKGAASLLFKPYKYYILTGGSKYLTHWFILFFSLLLNKKVLVWTHGMKGNKTGKARFLDKAYYRLSHKVLLYGNHSRNIMVKEGLNPDKLIPIYNSLDYLSQKEIRETLGHSSVYEDYFKNQHPVLFYIGRIQKSKKLDLLIEALNIFKIGNNPCNLVVIGKDVEQTGLSELVEKYQLQNNVWFYGPCYDEAKIGTMMYNADLCVSPGPIGLTAIHAMTYGVPIITNDNFEKQMPEYEVITKGITGDFYKENDLNDLVSKIKDWTNLSKIKREEVRKNAFHVVDTKYNPLFQINVLKNLIQ